jgi:hypothetical protein
MLQTINGAPTDMFDSGTTEVGESSGATVETTMERSTATPNAKQAPVARDSNGSSDSGSFSSGIIAGGVVGGIGGVFVCCCLMCCLAKMCKK